MFFYSSAISPLLAKVKNCSSVTCALELHRLMDVLPKSKAVFANDPKKELKSLKVRMGQNILK